MAPKQVNDDDIAGSRGASLQQMLQLSVQRLQWTYSLFWQLCPQQEALVWADGHYNGVIKTRKMVQPVETTAEEVALQRSQQLRELYESLSMGEDSQPSRRPCAALSPEDLTESEWFYLMCISFVFPPGVGLPGRAFEKKQPLWLAGANEVDSKVFSRAILAKGAQIQTVVCIPIVDGVLELGTTDRVEEDPDLIQLMKSFFSGYHHQRLLQGERPTVSEQSTSTPSGRQRHLQPAIPSPVPPADIHRGAGDDDHDHDDEDDEELDSSSDAGAVEEGEKPAGSPREMLQMQTSEEILLGSPDDGSNDIDADLQLLVMSQEEELYSQTVSTILQRNANRWGETCSSGNPLDLPRQSAFCAWTGGATADSRRAQQWMLKQALRGIPRLYSSGRSRKSGASPAEELSASHVLAERRRREKLNERFITLRSMVPCVTKMDKASILADTIEYLKKLLRRIQELEGKIKSMEMERRARGGGGGGGVAAREEPEKKKIKGMDLPLGFTGETSVQVSIIEADALLELRCPDREGLLLRMMQRIHELGLESIAVKSSVSAGVLIAQIRAKVENPAMGRTVSIADVQKALYGLISP